MTDFNIQPGYTGSWDTVQVGAFQGTNGMTGQGAMVGTDGLTYINIWVNLTGGLPKTVMALGVSDGSYYTYTNEDIADIFGESSDHFLSAAYNGKMILPLSGTSDFWYIVADPTPFPFPGIGSRFVYRGRRLRIEGGGAFSVQASWEADFGLGPTGNTSLMTDSGIFNFHFNPNTGTTRFIGSIGNQLKMYYGELPYGGGVTDFTYFTDISSNLDFFFFEFIGPSAQAAFFGCSCMGSPIGSPDFFMLYYVSPVSYAYIQANPTVSPNWGHITEPGVYRYDFAGGHSGPITGLDLSDAQKKLDGSATTASRPSADSPIDDYTSINTWPLGGKQYIVMARTYVDQADIATTHHGSIGRVKVFEYTDNTAVKRFDDTIALYDTITDLGVATINRDGYPINWLTTGVMPDNAFCIIAGKPHFEGNHNSNATIVLCSLFGPDQPFAQGFAAFTNDEFLDWGTEDFSSYLDTWHMVQDDTALWMEAPWIITYLDNPIVGTHPSCFMTPRWEWTESLAVHKTGPAAQLYIARPGDVSDRRNRVRGKGRALRLRYESERSKPFNLLGWSIDFDRNAEY